MRSTGAPTTLVLILRVQPLRLWSFSDAADHDLAYTHRPARGRSRAPQYSSPVRVIIHENDTEQTRSYALATSNAAAIDHCGLPIHAGDPVIRYGVGIWRHACLKCVAWHAEMTCPLWAMNDRRRVPPDVEFHPAPWLKRQRDTSVRNGQVIQMVNGPVPEPAVQDQPLDIDALRAHVNAMRMTPSRSAARVHVSAAHLDHAWLTPRGRCCPPSVAWSRPSRNRPRNLTPRAEVNDALVELDLRRRHSWAASQRLGATDPPRSRDAPRCKSRYVLLRRAARHPHQPHDRPEQFAGCSLWPQCTVAFGIKVDGVPPDEAPAERVN